MSYPNNVDIFYDKLNKKDNGVYVIEEEVIITDGKYEGVLRHDNVNIKSIRVFTGSKFTGNEIKNYIVSCIDNVAWKRHIKIFSKVTPVYITYETVGDQVEADDINNLQNSMVKTQKEMDRYKTHNTEEVSQIKVRLNSAENNKSDTTYVNGELLKKADKSVTYTKDETDQRIQLVINAAPEALNTLKELADALNNDPDFAATITNKLATKVDKVSGKGLSTEDYTTTEKTKLSKIEANANNYTHPSKHVATIITQDSGHRFVTDSEKSSWNAKETPSGATQKVTDAKTEVKGYTDQKVKDLLSSVPEALNTLKKIADAINNDPDYASNITTKLGTKVDKVLGKGLSTEDYTTAEKTKLSKIEANANNYTHPSKHVATIITQDSGHRFVTDSEKSSWNAKETPSGATQKVTDAKTEVKGYTDQKVKNLLSSVPEALNTLKKIADAINNDPDYASNITTKLGTKVDKVSGKGLSTEDYTTVEKTKLSKIEDNANNYSHPSKHAATIITQDTAHRFVTDSEKSSWNAKETPSGATKKVTDAKTEVKGYTDQKVKDLLSSVPDALNTLKKIADAIGNNPNYASNITTKLGTKVDKVSGKGLSTEDYTTAEKTKLSKIEANANNYTHPSKHAATIITQDSGHRFVTDSEKTSWNSKASGNHTHNPHHTHSNKGILDKISTTGSESSYDLSKFVTNDELGNAGYGDMLKAVYDKNNNGKVDHAEKADSVSWNNVSDKPSKFAPSTHTHSYLPLSGGTLTGKLTIADEGSIVFRDANGEGMAMDSNGENWRLYEPEDKNKTWLEFKDDDGLYVLGTKVSLVNHSHPHNHDSQYLPKGGITWNQLKGV